VDSAVLDRGGRLFHGRVAALAEGAREKGLQI
jgi:ribosomal protein L18